MVGIFIGLVLLMVLAYFGWSIIWIAPICAGVVALFGGLDLLDAYTDTYMQGFVDFTKEWFPVFMLGAIFGKLMEFSGMAHSVARWFTKLLGKNQAIIGIVLAAAVLAYGGVSVFVVVFAVYPIGVSMFKEANIPRRLMPAVIIAGMMTFAMTALPGTPQIQNLIPVEYFQTTAAAAPILGFVATIFMAGGSIIYLKWRQKRLQANGEYFIDTEKDKEQKTVDHPPNFILSILPLTAVVVTLNVFKWDIVIALLTGILIIMVVSMKNYKELIPSLNKGAGDSVMAMINTSAAVGFGTVVQAVPGFQRLTDIIMGVDTNPFVSLTVSTNVLAGSTGSASGGLGITMEALGKEYYEIAMSRGIDPEAFHRIASISSGGLDALPHNGAILTILIVTGMTHKESYSDIAIVGILIPLISLIPVIILATFGVS
ncbi:GntP family permease [Virgibacillus sp. NKC19-3]|uniref:GntP family permease n=1 Tax=Virgibacillus saliphilus TaxID=2831674 RepID=UPI001C9AC45F|nr:GntP family permease [Virgibacillus sp. NKC19-3]MBY7144281.1 GntP family permease [Virgibacillus sp. NKC19-3]